MSNDFICRHIKTNGEQCGSPHLRDQPFCYFHYRLHGRRHAGHRHQTETLAPILDRSGNFLGMEAQRAPEPNPPIELGALEDRGSVQVAISTVVNALASGELDIRRATALLYGLQLASSNCPAGHGLPHSHAHAPVTEVVETSDGLLLAPELPYPEQNQESSRKSRRMKILSRSDIASHVE